jgi:ribonuclease Z
MDLPTEPTPFFHDKNITAYSIPIFSTSNLSLPEHYPQVVLRKRKLSTSPVYAVTQPSYAVNRPSEATDSKGRPVISDSMSNVIRTPNFHPEELSGQVASEWRELVIRTMFPHTNLPDVPSTVSLPPDPYIPDHKRRRTLLLRPVFNKNLEEGRK